MSGFLKGIVFCLAAFFGSSAFAGDAQNDVQIGRGVICDTQEQAERFVTLFKGNAGETLNTVNLEAKKENACAVAAVAYLPGDVSATATGGKGEAFRVVKILVLGVVTELGVQHVPPFPQYTILKAQGFSI